MTDTESKLYKINNEILDVMHDLKGEDENITRDNPNFDVWALLVTTSSLVLDCARFAGRKPPTCKMQEHTSEELIEELRGRINVLQ